MDVALLSILRDGLMRRSEAETLTWADVELRDNGTALLQVRRSKTEPEGEGVVLYIGKEAGEALRAIRPPDELLDLNTPVFGLSSKQIGRRVQAAAKAAGLGEGFTGHSGRVGMAQALVKSGVELPALMTAGRWKSSKMSARYTERQAAGQGPVAIRGFEYRGDHVVCPQGKVLKQAGYHRRNASYQYLASQKDCQACPIKEQCLPPRQKRRYLEIWPETGGQPGKSDYTWGIKK